MIKDEEYFNTGFFNHINDELKEECKKLAKNESKQLYEIIDEGLKLVLKNRNIKFDKNPRRAVFID